MTCEHEASVAAYALGTLVPEERVEVHDHLQRCDTCRTRWQEVAPLAPLLARVSPADAAAGLPVPKQQVLDRVLDAAAREVAARGRRRRLVAAAAAVLLVAGAGAAAVAQRDPGTVTVAGEQGDVQARVQLDASDGGTDLALELVGVPAGQLCRLVVVAADGTRDVTSTWEATYAGRATTLTRTDIALERIDRLVVETLDGRRLVELPVPD